MSTIPHYRRVLRAFVLAVALVALPAAAADGDKTRIKGLVTAVQDDTITVRDGNNVEQTITLSADTVYKKTRGLTGVIHEKVERTALIPGLPVAVEAVPAGSGFTAPREARWIRREG